MKNTQSMISERRREREPVYERNASLFVACCFGDGSCASIGFPRNDLVKRIEPRGLTVLVFCLLAGVGKTGGSGAKNVKLGNGRIKLM